MGATSKGYLYYSFNILLLLLLHNCIENEAAPFDTDHVVVKYIHYFKVRSVSLKIHPATNKLTLGYWMYYNEESWTLYKCTLWK